jgi:hypothetical protein
MGFHVLVLFVGKMTDWVSEWLQNSCDSLLSLDNRMFVRQIQGVRAHGMWTYEPRQGRKAATVVCSVSAVVTLTL